MLSTYGMLRRWRLRRPSTYLDGLDKGKEKDADANAPPKQFDEPGCTEQAEKADIDNLSGVDDTTQDSDEIERVPRVFEVWLKWQWQVDEKVS